MLCTIFQLKENREDRDSNPGFEPGAAGREALSLPLCHAPPIDKDLASLTFGARLAWNVGGTNDPFGRSDKGEARGDSPG